MEARSGRRRAFGCRPLFGWMPCFRLHGQTTGGQERRLTPLFDALIFAADFIAQHRRAGVQPVLILFSDGNDTISVHSASEALRAAQGAGTMIYAVDLGSSLTSGGKFLQRVADGTGGRYFYPRFSGNQGAAALLNTVFEDLRASYVVTYDLPSHQAGFHALRLLPTHNLNLTFHSRGGTTTNPAIVDKRRRGNRDWETADWRFMKSTLLLALVLTGISVAFATPIGIYQQGTVVRMHMGDCQLMHRGFMNQFGPPQAAMIEDSCPEYTLVTDKFVGHRGQVVQPTCAAGGNHRFSFREQRLGDSRGRRPQGIKILDQGDDIALAMGPCPAAHRARTHGPPHAPVDTSLARGTGSSRVRFGHGRKLIHH